MLSQRKFKVVSELGQRLFWWEWILEICIQLVVTRKLIAIKNLFRVKRAVSLPENLELPSRTFPEIEILSVVAGKDIEVLALALESALLSSANPVAKISLICPARDVSNCRREVAKIKFDGTIQIIDENLILNSYRRNEILLAFGNRYGWVLQQFLAVEHILNSKHKGVLLLNSDTILIRRAHWLDGLGNQLMLVSLEFHKPYYELLGKVMGFSRNPKYTFVTHHMLFQPEKFKAILGSRGFQSTEEFQRAVIQNAEPGQSSPLCVEFEPYGQGMCKDFLNFVHLRKFSNVSIRRDEFDKTQILKSIDGKLDYRYNSLSLHDYL